MFFKGFISLLFLHNAPVVRQFVLQVNLFQSTTHYFVLHQVIHINLDQFEFNLDQFANLSFVLICFFLFPFVCGSTYLSTINRLTNQQKKQIYITYCIWSVKHSQCNAIFTYIDANQMLSSSLAARREQRMSTMLLIFS